MLFSSIVTTPGLIGVVLAQAPKQWSQDHCVDTSQGFEVATIQGLECVFSNVVSVVVSLAGLAVFIVLLVGGLKYLTSGGDPKAQEQAKNTMTYAVFGLVLIVAAYLILNFISTFTGIPGLLNFTIPKGP